MFLILVIVLISTNIFSEDFSSSAKTSEHHISKSHDFSFRKESESGEFRTTCSKCNDKFQIFSRRYDSYGVIDYVRILGLYSRSEIATARLDKERDLVLSWDLRIDSRLDTMTEATISQIIGWQKSCHEFGNYHVRFDHGDLKLWVRHVGNKRVAKKIYEKIPKGEWFNIKVSSKFSAQSGYFYITVTTKNQSKTTKIYENEPTYIDCPNGPYMKFGYYGAPPTNSTLDLKNLSVEYL